MPRYKLTIEYDGAPYTGWQKQPHALSVQECVENAIEKFCGGRQDTVCAGRTDAGVHARGQVIHVDLPRDDKPFTVQQGINYHLRPEPIAIVHAEPVTAEFHARFSATRRHYLYRIVNRKARLALDKGQVWRVARELDVTAMQAAANHLLGSHDFTSFRASECQALSPVKTLDMLNVEMHDSAFERNITITANARSFLHHQMRNITGTLVEVGLGKLKPSDIPKIIEAKSRAAAGPTAPPTGLYLMQVDYEK